MSEEAMLSTSTPADVRVIADLNVLKVVADPLRLQLLELLREEAQSVKQLAKRMDYSAKKLYYHINLLEEHGLIRVVDTQVVSGIIEKYYYATAYRLSVDHSLLSPDEGPTDSHAAILLSTILDRCKQEVAKGVRHGLIELGPEQSLQKRALVLGSRRMRLSPARADAFLERIRQLEREFEADEEPEEQTLCYELLLGLYPTESH